MEYEAIVYDIDGTLLNTVDMNMYPLIQVIYKELGIVKTFDEVKKYFCLTGKETMNRLNLDYDTVYPKWVKYVNEYKDKAIPYDGILEVLAAVKKMNLKQGVASAKNKNQYEIDMKNSHLYDYIDAAVLFEDTDKHKPDPEPLLCMLKKLDLPPNKVLYIGDAIVDRDASIAAGIDFAQAKWAGLIEEDLSGAKYYLSSPNELLDILKK